MINARVAWSPTAHTMWSSGPFAMFTMNITHAFQTSISLRSIIHSLPPSCPLRKDMTKGVWRFCGNLRYVEHSCQPANPGKSREVSITPSQVRPTTLIKRKPGNMWITDMWGYMMSAYPLKMFMAGCLFHANLMHGQIGTDLKPKDGFALKAREGKGQK